MLGKLTPADFSKCLNKAFNLRLESATLVLELITVDEPGTGAPGGGRRQPFSLTFRGPEEPVLPQRVYALEHATMGRLEIFLVPIGPDEAGICYQAVFS